MNLGWFRPILCKKKPNKTRKSLDWAWSRPISKNIKHASNASFHIIAAATPLISPSLVFLLSGLMDVVIHPSSHSSPSYFLSPPHLCIVPSFCFLSSLIFFFMLSGSQVKGSEDALLKQLRFLWFYIGSAIFNPVQLPNGYKGSPDRMTGWLPIQPAGLILTTMHITTVTFCCL